jgi:hypothetical protein
MCYGTRLHVPTGLGVVEVVGRIPVILRFIARQKGIVRIAWRSLL